VPAGMWKLLKSVTVICAPPPALEERKGNITMVFEKFMAGNYKHFHGY